jgi:hypothetical protein
MASVAPPPKPPLPKVKNAAATPMLIVYDLERNTAILRRQLPGD